MFLYAIGEVKNLLIGNPPAEKPAKIVTEVMNHAVYLTFDTFSLFQLVGMVFSLALFKLIE